MVVFDIGYSYSHVCVCSLGRITHLVHRTGISFKCKTILLCIANSIKYIIDHIHHIPYLFCLSHISITFINKTNPSNPLKRKKYRKHTLKTFGANNFYSVEYM